MSVTMTAMEPRLNDPAPARSGMGPSRRQGADEPVEVRRYIDALRRGRWLILTLAVSAALVAFILSSLAPNRYTSTAIIVKRITSATTDTASSDTLSRELATIGQLLVTTDVLGRAAQKVGGGETATSLSQSVKSTVNPDANLINVTATAKEDPKKAAAIANAVADTFVKEQADVTRQQYEAARQGLLQQLSSINHNDPAASQQEQAIRQRLSDLGVAQAAAGIDLRVAQRAGVPKTRSSPKPLRNSIIAFFLGLFIGVLVALGRDLLVPRVSGARELSRLLDLPMLAAIPYVRRRWGRGRNILTGAEYEAYQTLGASVRFSLPAEEGPHVVLITSGLHAEGKSTVTARLGRALAQAGHRTLLISADLRWPTLHEIMGVEEEPGLTELLLEAGERGTGRNFQKLVKAAIVPVDQGRRGDLEVLPSGTKPNDAARLLAGDGLDAVLDTIKGMGFAYVLIDAPPLLGIADTRALARLCTSLLFVARLDRITLDTVIDARDVLDRLEIDTVGCVPVGTRSEASPYYMGLRTPALEDA
jgi:Mrp family chromosome partitioning ATPase/capsular polysaccharide biosynthesis protein